MYYGFDVKTKRCVWSIDTLPQTPEGFVVVASDTEHDISTIMLTQDDDGNASIGERVLSEQEQIAQAKLRQQLLMQQTKAEIDTLNDVMEFAPNDEAKEKLKAHRAYRAALYMMDFSTLENIAWPDSPKA